jgi:phosphatidylglycerophosphate synthase
LMVPVLWILAVFTHVTVLQRIHYTWKQLKRKTDVGRVDGAR